MSRIDIEMADDLVAFARERADAENLSLEAYIELLIGLESGLRDQARDGRAMWRRAFVYRGEAQILADRTAAA
ncbi:hypothetical protein [Methylocapsa aurea]|uniref:hypothetical protein n=1 Tax=Methylocapsa aurea TaxID=663610 RepID=UPI00056D77B7|nr:hypothetical protein [Methylocapsa aurea]